MRIKPSIVSLAAGLAVAVLTMSAYAQPLPWMNESLAAEEREKLLVSAMTPKEKFQQMVGEPGIVPELPDCHIPGLPRLEIPTFRITNGPVGVGQNDSVPTETFTGNPGSLMKSQAPAQSLDNGPA